MYPKFIELQAYDIWQDRNDRKYYKMLVNANEVTALKDMGSWCILVIDRHEYNITQPYEEVRNLLRVFDKDE